MKKFIFFLIFIISKCYSVLKFEILTQSLREKEKNDETFYDLANDNLELINFSIGTPLKQIQLSLSFQLYTFYISGSKNSKFSYNEKNSKSYKQILINETYIDDYHKGFYSSENFLLQNKINLNNFPFILATKNSGYLNKIGLRLMIEKEKNLPNFIFDLKKNNITKSNLWSIKFNKKTNYKTGELIIGEEYKNLNWTKIELKYLEWTITFDDVFFNEYKIIDCRDAKFNLDFGLISIPEYFMKYLIHKYVDNINCKKIESYFYGYISFACNKNFNISQFPSFKFFNREFRANLTLDYNDLFYEYENLNYSLICSGKDDKYLWVLGKPFLKKFQFVFDPDNKLIAYYQHDEKFIFNKNIIYSIITIVMIIIIIFLILFIKYMIKKKRKIRVNEIEEIYEYKTHE